MTLLIRRMAIQGCPQYQAPWWMMLLTSRPTSFFAVSRILDEEDAQSKAVTAPPDQAAQPAELFFTADNRLGIPGTLHRIR